MRARRFFWLRAYQILAGCSDTATGIALLFLPATTLRWMGIEAENSSLIWFSYIGAFVLAVGLTYFLVFVEESQSPDPHSGWRMQWRITALARTLVALLIVWKFAAGDMPWQWLEVAATDGAYAALQWAGLARGWLRDGE